MTADTVDLSVIIVSYNAADYLRRCLQAVEHAGSGLAIETIVVDNLSKDNSCQVVEQEFPQVTLLRGTTNLGFAAANNLAMRRARGRYLLLLNSDCFIAPDALRLSISLMDAMPQAGAAGPRLYFEDGRHQVSARMLPNLFTEFFSLSDLSDHHPQSRLFAYADRTCDDPAQPAPVGWVTGAYMLLRAELLKKIGLLDEDFYFYYEDLDLCARVHQAGSQVWYWPQIEAVHIGGGSASRLDQPFTPDGALVILWRMRSMLLFYRKHHPVQLYLVTALELLWYSLRALRNRLTTAAHGPERTKRFRSMAALLLQAWHETKGGKISPPRPWK